MAIAQNRPSSECLKTISFNLNESEQSLKTPFGIWQNKIRVCVKWLKSINTTCSWDIASLEPRQAECMLFRISNVFLTFHFSLEFFRISDALAYGETFQSQHFLCLLQMDSMPYVGLGALIASPLLAFRFIVVVSSFISLVASYLWLWYEIYCKYLIYPYFSNSGESCSNTYRTGESNKYARAQFCTTFAGCQCNWEFGFVFSYEFTILFFVCCCRFGRRTKWI